MDMNKRFNFDEIKALSSEYIDKGIKQESWQIDELVVEGNILKAKAHMTSYFVSPTDPEGFHLSAFCSLEILSQLANILLHVVAGHTEKCCETWVRECTFTYRNPIRNGENIQIEMKAFNARIIGEKLIGWTKCKVFDDQGGLFEAQLKGMLR